MGKDFLAPKQRAELMAKVRSRDTTPEKVVRQLLHRMGYRFRLYRKGLPGRPDVAFIKRRKAIFVHGCFWHGHNCKSGLNRPKSNISYWEPKLKRTKARDEENKAMLQEIGWKVLVLWECQLKDSEELTGRLRTFLEG